MPREINSIGRDVVLYMQGPAFEPRTPHLFPLKGQFLATRLLDRKINKGLKNTLVLSDL